MGGLFGAIGVLGALIQRGITGKGMEVQSALYENNVFLVGQHMLQYAITGKPAAPMPARDNPWAVYDVFTVKDGEQIFLAAVSDAQWQTFCDALGFADLKAEPDARHQQPARQQRPGCWPLLRERLAPRSAAELVPLMEKAGLPFAPIRRPEDLYDDEHLLATGGLADITLPDGPRAGETAKTTLLPLHHGRQRLGVRLHPPRAGRAQPRTAGRAGLRHAEIDDLQGARGHQLKRAPIHDSKKETSMNTTNPRRTRKPTPGHRKAGRAALGGGPLGAAPLAGPVRRAVRFILPVGAGSGVDTITRAASAALGKALNAGGDRKPARRGRHRRPAALVARRPTACTLSVVSNNHVIFPSVYKSLPFDPSATSRPSPWSAARRWCWW
jgi:hypothetical protein